MTNFSLFQRSGLLIACLMVSMTTFAQEAPAPDQPAAGTYPMLTVEKYDKFGMALMNPCETGENLALNDPNRPSPPQYCGHNYQVPYFGGNPALDNAPTNRRDNYRQVIFNGIPYAALPPHAVHADGVFFYVMDKFGNFFFFLKDGADPVHHSSFFDGAPIASGGEIQIVNGKITSINTETGHYLMTSTIMKNAEQALSDDGVTDLSTDLPVQ